MPEKIPVAVLCKKKVDVGQKTNSGGTKSMTIEYPVSCPLMDGEKIDRGTCFDIHMVVEGDAPPYTAPEQAISKGNFRDICCSCIYHRDD